MDQRTTAERLFNSFNLCVCVSTTGWRDGAERHTPLQEEVRHHLAIQTHLSGEL